MMILVTGATGFIGGHLTRALLASSHRVRAVVRETSNWTWLAAEGVEIVKGSFLDIEFATEACAGIEVVVNAIGKMGGPSVRESEMREVNVTSVATLLEASQSAGVRQFIHCSTPGVVGMVGVAPECMPYSPAGPYERTKCEGEKLALSAHRSGRIAATVIRPDFVYGPGDLHKLKLFKAIRHGSFPIIGSGRSLLHPTYVDDVVGGLMLMIDNPAAYGEVFNIAGPEPVSVVELASAIASGLGVREPSTRIPAFVAKAAALGAEIGGKVIGKAPGVTRYQVDFFAKSHASDISKAKQMLGFSPEVTLDEGIKRTIRWYADEGYLQ